MLLLILAFNWVGYRFVSGFLERRADIVLESKIDHAQYDESTLMEIKIPLNAPYLSGNSTVFQRFYGEIELKGIHYQYVKRKVVNGELVLLCIRNENKNRIRNSGVDFFKLVNDIHHSTQGKENSAGSSGKSFTTEYKEQNNSWNIIALNAHHEHNSMDDCPFYTANPRLVRKQPPRVIVA